MFVHIIYNVCGTDSVEKGLKIELFLRFIYTRDLDLAILLSDAISIEILPSFQIGIAGDSDNV
jgi:hypothetical protein